MVGGLEDEKTADEHVKRVISSIEKEFQTKYPREYQSIEPISYRTQVVSGMNYFIKVSRRTLAVQSALAPSRSTDRSHSPSRHRL